jgi:hypothetical protein
MDTEELDKRRDEDSMISMALGGDKVSGGALAPGGEGFAPPLGETPPRGSGQECHTHP